MQSNMHINTQVSLVFNSLSEYYGESILRKGWRGDKSWWQAKSALELMVGSILVQNTNWRNVDKALGNFGENLSAQYILKISNEALAEIIRPAGFQNQKAKKLKALCEWFSHYNFDVYEASSIDKDTLRDELLAINGVGNETADAILVYVLNKTSFVIDAYARRIFTRIGFSIPKAYDAFRTMIEDAIPCNVTTYDYYHGLLVEHAKEFCTKTPKCVDCPLFNGCERNIQ